MKSEDSFKLFQCANIDDTDVQQPQVQLHCPCPDPSKKTLAILCMLSFNLYTILQENTEVDVDVGT